MPVVSANGIRLHVQIMGKGPSVVMLHGAGVDSLASWYFTVAPVLARTHRVVLYDLRGHGLSERAKTGYDLKSMSADLLGIINQCCGSAASLVGHSYGALIALQFTLDHPELVKDLAIIEAPLPPGKKLEFNDFIRKTPAEMVQVLPESRQAFIGQGGRRDRKFFEAIRFLAFESTMVQDLSIELDFADALLATISCPVLCLYGDHSPCLAAGDRLNRVLPGACLRILSGSHLLHLDNPEEIARQLLYFIKEASHA